MVRDLVAVTRLAVVAAAILGAKTKAMAGWEVVEPMPTARAYHAGATVGGLWYVGGGEKLVGGGIEYPAEVDVFDPVEGHWTRVGDLSEGRKYFRAIAEAAASRVFFVGGFILGGAGGFEALAICDYADAGGVIPMPMLSNARYLHAAAFASGRVVVSGGWGSPMMLDDAEAFDGAVWRPAGRMPAGSRVGHTMTTLADGARVVVVGGCQPDHAMREVDMLDAVSSAWSTASNVGVPRCRHKAVLLADGRILVAGSINLSDVSASAEVFDATSGHWTTVAAMQDARYDHDMVLLPDGRVIVAGGTNNARDGEFGALNTVEVYDPLADTWTAAPPMRDRRRWPTLAVLTDGVYVAGGDYATGTSPNDVQVLDSVERLTWADLPPRGSGAERPDAAVWDATSGDVRGDGPNDDAESDAGAGTQDGPAVDHPTDSARSGCSCDLVASHDETVAALAMVAAWLCVVGRARPGARQERRSLLCRHRVGRG